MTPAAARRASLAALLRVERAARVRFSASTSLVATRAAHALRAGAAPHIVMVSAAHMLEQHIARDVFMVRSAARRDALATLSGEMIAAGLARIDIARRPAVAPVDHARAAAAGKVISAGWLGASLARGTANDLAPVAVPAAALAGIQARLETTAITEASSAFSDEREDETDDYAVEAERRWLPLPLKVWDATNDRKVCRVCNDLDGALRPFGIAFPGDAVPGAAHPRCRCVLGIAPLPVPLRKAA